MSYKYKVSYILCVGGRSAGVVRRISEASRGSASAVRRFGMVWWYGDLGGSWLEFQQVNKLTKQASQNAVRYRTAVQHRTLMLQGRSKICSNCFHFNLQVWLTPPGRPCIVPAHATPKIADKKRWSEARRGWRRCFRPALRANRRYSNPRCTYAACWTSQHSPSGPRLSVRAESPYQASSRSMNPRTSFEHWRLRCKRSWSLCPRSCQALSPPGATKLPNV